MSPLKAAAAACNRRAHRAWRITQQRLPEVASANAKLLQRVSCERQLRLKCLPNPTARREGLLALLRWPLSKLMLD